jgi:gamma-glutamyltranspeptidase/glutathione hydrolase
MMRQNFCVSAGHPIAAELAADVLRDGGNAVDAGVAACIALCVLHCEQVQLGGIAPMMLRMADLAFSDRPLPRFQGQAS